MKFEKQDIWQTAVVSLIGWILFTIYSLNGRVSSQGESIISLNNQVAQVQTTTNSIYNFMLEKSTNGFNDQSVSMSN